MSPGAAYIEEFEFEEPHMVSTTLNIEGANGGYGGACADTLQTSFA